MKFIDEAVITVESGQGGRGCSSFRREKYVPRGGPDGGDGGRGGDVVLKASDDLNTLVDFRYQRFYKAENGQPGRGKNCSGVGGKPLVITVPVGTVIYEVETNLVLGDLTEDGQELLVAKGGRGGLGNTHFKSSTNRAPRKSTPGFESERREIRLELSLLADVGLLGLPNAGKSTLIRCLSNARPKVANYPFTTLVPNIGVVRVNRLQSFVLADVPGLIPGAAEGAGLGIRFLKHLARTRLLLHMVDVGSALYEDVEFDVAGDDALTHDPTQCPDPATAVQVIAGELASASDLLAEQPRWLVLNKCDLLSEEALEALQAELVAELDWTGPVYQVSASTGAGAQALAADIMAYLEQQKAQADADAAYAEKVALRQRQMQQEVRLAAKRRRSRSADDDILLDDALSDDDDLADDDHDVEVIYVQ